MGRFRGAWAARAEARAAREEAANRWRSGERENTNVCTAKSADCQR